MNRIIAPLIALVLASQASAQHQPPMKIDVDLVMVNASVSDHKGKAVTGLDKGHFEVWEDKVAQDIRYFSAEEVPISLGIVFDISGSMRNKFAVSRDAVLRFLQTGGPRDEYSLIEFSDHPQLTQDFTSDIKEFQDRISLATPGGYTALYDAVYLGIERMRHAHNGRKALLLVTDGEDNHSHYNFNDVKELAKEADVQLFAIGIPGYPGLQLGTSMIDARKGNRVPGQDVLEELVDLAGGQAFFTRDVRDLDGICQKISANLRNEYVIGYAPTNPSKDGKWRKLHLKVNDVSHVSVHARSGYYAPVQ